MHAFMQSLQMRWPVAATVGLSITITASAESALPWLLSVWNSEIFSSSGQPASVTPNALFLKITLAGSSAGGFSFKPFEHESFDCVWHQMQ
jgi:hypothetical protein